MIKQGYVGALLTMGARDKGHVNLSFIEMDGFTSVGVTQFDLNRAEALAFIAGLTEALNMPEPDQVSIRINPLAIIGKIEEIDDYGT